MCRHNCVLFWIDYIYFHLPNIVIIQWYTLVLPYKLLPFTLISHQQIVNLCPSSATQWSEHVEFGKSLSITKRTRKHKQNSTVAYFNMMEYIHYVNEGTYYRQWHRTNWQYFLLIVIFIHQSVYVNLLHATWNNSAIYCTLWYITAVAQESIHRK